MRRFAMTSTAILIDLVKVWSDLAALGQQELNRRAARENRFPAYVTDHPSPQADGAEAPFVSLQTVH